MAGQCEHRCRGPTSLRTLFSPNHLPQVCLFVAFVLVCNDPFNQTRALLKPTLESEPAYIEHLLPNRVPRDKEEHRATSPATVTTIALPVWDPLGTAATRLSRRPLCVKSISSYHLHH